MALQTELQRLADMSDTMRDQESQMRLLHTNLAESERALGETSAQLDALKERLADASNREETLRSMVRDLNQVR